MKEASDNELVRYLLGDMSDEEQSRIEEQCFSDRTLFERLLEVEDDLIDAYVTKKLSAGDGERFEKYFLRTPERRERLEFARAWAAYLATAPDAQITPQQADARKINHALWIPIAASVLLMIGASWLLVRTAWLRTELEQERSERASLESLRQDLERQVEEQTARSRQLERELESEKASRQQTEMVPPPAAVLFALTSNLVRGSGGDRLEIPANASQVRLQVSFRKSEHTSFNAVLKTVGGAQIRRWSSLTPQGRTLIFQLPASALKTDDYILTLSALTPQGAIEVIDEYAFRVVKK